MHNVGKLSIGIDVGGTKLAVALVDDKGKILEKDVVYEHLNKTPEQFLDYISELINEILNRRNLTINDIEGIGLCFPGYIRFKEGIIITACNVKGFENFPLKTELQKRFNTKVLVDNDANCQAFAEYKFGAARDFNDLIFITLSTGIGGGIILNNKLFRGMTGSAGEFGHMIIESKSESDCTCGNKGCWMSCSSGKFLNRTAKKLMQKGYKSKLITSEALENGEVDGIMLKHGFMNNDELCKAIISEFSQYMAVGLVNIFHIFNPPIVVLGGGLMKIGEDFLKEIQIKFKVLARDMIHDEMQIRLTELEGNAAVIGAAAIVIDETKDSVNRQNSKQEEILV